MSDPTDICAWQRLDERTTTSGKLTAEDIDKLADAGIKHVINLAPNQEGSGALAGEGDLLAGRGIRYSYIPVPFLAPDESQYEAFVETYESDEEPVHVHCIANWRVSAFFYRYNRDHRSMDEGAARELMEQQWSPEKTDYAEVWAPFISRKD